MSSCQRNALETKVANMDRTRTAMIEAEQAAEAAVRSAVYEYVTMHGVSDERALRIAATVLGDLEELSGALAKLETAVIR